MKILNKIMFYTIFNVKQPFIEICVYISEVNSWLIDLLGSEMYILWSNAKTT